MAIRAIKLKTPARRDNPCGFGGALRDGRVCLRQMVFCRYDRVAGGLQRDQPICRSQWLRAIADTFCFRLLHEKTFLPDDLPRSLAEYEEAVALSPYDYRFWFELGKARERNGDALRAEAALRKALALAPNYSQVQWALGNFLLREGKSEEAFVEIRKAAEGDKNFANPAITGAWQLFQGDTAQIKKYAGDSDNLKAALAALLAKEKHFDEALEVWESLPEAVRKSEFRSNGEEIYQKMIEAKKFRAALQALFANQSIGR